MTASPRIVIVGAGISGLSVAYRLQQRLPDADITILEQADRVGGTTWTLREQGFQLEMGPNGFLDTKPTTLTLCQDLGLQSQLITASEAAGKNRYLFLHRSLKALPAGFASFLWSDLLSWRGKLSLLWERFRKRRADDDDESIDAFARRRTGGEVADVFADALVTGIYAGDPKLLSMPACFPRVWELEGEHGSVMKGFSAAAKQRRAEARAKGQPYQRPGKMRSFAGGLRVLVEQLTERLAHRPLTGIRIRYICKTGDAGRPTWRVQAEGGDAWTAEAVVLTCPAYQQAAILSDVDASLAEQIGAIAYNRIVVVGLGYRRADVTMPLDGFGFISPQSTKRDLLGVQWCSSIFPQRAPEDCVLLRAMCGGWQRPEMVDWDDARLLASLREELRQTMHITAEPVFHKIVRWDRAIPQYHLGHLDRVARIGIRADEHHGLFLGGNAYYGVSLNDCTERGSILAERIAKYVG